MGTDFGGLITLLPAQYVPMSADDYKAAVEALAELLAPIIRQVVEGSSTT